MLTGTIMEELANIITCVTGDARKRRTIYEADQNFERFGKTLITNFKDTETLWVFLRASLRQFHIHKLSKVGKDKTAWAKADEYLTNLMDSDTMLSLENTNDAIKRAENYMHRLRLRRLHACPRRYPDAGNTDGHDEVNTLRAALKEKDQRLPALRPSSTASHTGKRTAATSARRQRKRLRKNATTAKRLASGSKGTMNLNVCTRRRMKQKQDF
jgi:hypothetical protein